MEIEYDHTSKFIEEYWPDYGIIQEKMEQPTAELVIEYYQHFRVLIYKFLSQVIGDDLQAPTVENDGIFNLLHFTNKFLKCGTNKQEGFDSNLTLTDIYAPTARRTQIRMKLLMNMLVFLYTDLNPIQGVVQQNKQLSNTTALVKNRCQELHAELAKQAESIATIDDEYEKFERKLKQVEANYQNLQEQKEDKDQNHKQLQQELKTALDTYQDKQTLAKNLKANIAHWNKQVVFDERYKSLHDLNQNLHSKCSQLEIEENYTAESLSVKKPDIDRFNVIYKEIDLLIKDACLKQMIRKNVITLQSEVDKVEITFNEHLKEIKGKEENITKLKNSEKEIKAACQSSLVQSNTVTQSINEEIEQINNELSEELNCQKKLCARKKLLDDKITENQKILFQIQNAIKDTQNVTSGIYERIIATENPAVSALVAVFK